MGAGGGSPQAHVIVADGDLHESRVLSWLLRERGYGVSAVPPGDALIDLIHSRRADLVLLDGNGSTRETLRRIRADENGRHIPVIVTGVPSSIHAESAIEDGADDWVPKPLRAAEVVARVSAQLRVRADLRTAHEALRRRSEELERAQDDVATTRQLVEILNEVTGELTANEIYRVLARRVARALDLRHCSVVLTSAGESTGVVVAAFDDPNITHLQVNLDRYPELVEAVRTGRLLLVSDVAQDHRFAEIRELWKREDRQIPVRSVITIPFTLDRKQSGIFFLRTEVDERALTEEDARFADVVVRAAVAAIRRAQALDSTLADNRRLEQLATTDSLTRLLNRRALLDRLSVEVDRARRFKSHLSLLMVDLDHFKQVNDTYGHLVGDSVLRQLAGVLAGLVRTVDVIARYGGEEFVVILPETASIGARTFAERLRERTARHLFDIGAKQPIHLTCSVGVATFPSPRVASTEDLFARADEALYRAKSGGRNQVRT